MTTSNSTTIAMNGASSTLPVHDLHTASGRDALETTLTALRSTASLTSEAGQVTAGVLEDVANRGDDAVVEAMRKWTDPGFEAQRIRVTRDELEAARSALTGRLGQAVQTSIDHVWRYQEHVRPRDIEPINIDGAECGLRWTPVERVGLCVPGGTAVLFSTLIMLAVPALVAGVRLENIHVISPPPTRGHGQPAGDISPLVLAVAQLLGIENVYRIGGAQGVAALAHGTESVWPVDLIAGPGNVYVQLAKAQLAGLCGTDNGFYGPSEIVTIADDSANPTHVASDLIAQAEHNPGKCFLITWSSPALEKVLAEVNRQLDERQRREAIEAALRDESAAVLVEDLEQATQVADRFAAEHVNLAVNDPQALLNQLRHGGEFFLGDQTPVAAGDYYAGPSHCLPTATTARFTSGISAHTFLKRSGTVNYPGGMSDQTMRHIAQLAEAEGLDAHATSAHRRAGQRSANPRQNQDRSAQQSAKR